MSIAWDILQITPCMNAETRRGQQVSSSFALCLIFISQIFHWIRSWPSWLVFWWESTQILLDFSTQCLDCRQKWAVQCFYMSSGNANSCPMVCSTSGLIHWGISSTLVFISSKLYLLFIGTLTYNINGFFKDWNDGIISASIFTQQKNYVSNLLVKALATIEVVDC